MNLPPTLETPRLRLRQWQDSDLPAFAGINADPQVMAYYPRPLSTEESDNMAGKLQGLIKERGWGLWAVEEKSSGTFVGFVGLHQPVFELPVTPCIEIGWRLGKTFWGRGYATEAASKCLQFAFELLQLDNVYSFTSVTNHRSIAVMERLGMCNMNQNFEHPVLPVGHALREHVLYRINRQQWG